MATAKRIKLTTSNPEKKINEVLVEKKITKGNLITISETEDSTILWYWEY
ncbi:hypothetical protein [Tenacibaculum singaporense]|nr:hypothetical protein [Tenacibaculum singaporense]